MKLGEKITILRKARGFSQEQLGLSLATKDNGVSRQTVSDWENGRTEPKLDNIRALADLLDVSYDALLDEELDLRNPECLSAVLSGGAIKTEEALSDSSLFLYKRGYGLAFIALLLLVVGIGLGVMLPSFHQAKEFFAQSAARNGDATVMGQTLHNRAIIHQSLGIAGAAILAIGAPVSIGLWIASIRKDKPCGLINRKEIILYPRQAKNKATLRLPLEKIERLERAKPFGIVIHGEEEIRLKNIKDRKQIIEAFNAYKG